MQLSEDHNVHLFLHIKLLISNYQLEVFVLYVRSNSFDSRLT